VVLYGKPYNTASGERITVNGETTFVIPLFGDKVEDVKTGLDERYTLVIKHGSLQRARLNVNGYFKRRTHNTS